MSLTLVVKALQLFYPLVVQILVKGPFDLEDQLLCSDKLESPHILCNCIQPFSLYIIKNISFYKLISNTLMIFITVCLPQKFSQFIIILILGADFTESLFFIHFALCRGFSFFPSASCWKFGLTTHC